MSKTTAPVPQRMQREPPKPSCATDEEAKEWAAKWWQDFSATDWRGGKAAEGRLYQDAAKLFDLMRPATDDGLAPVKLVRGSWLLNRAKQLRHASTDEERAKLRMPRRQELERDEPDALLYGAYRAAMLEARRKRLPDVAFCLLSAGAFRGQRSLHDVLAIGGK